MPVLVIDRAGAVAAAWRERYDPLRLNTPRDCSHLPNRPYPAGTAALPTRADVVEHLTRHAREDGIKIRLDTEVHRIDRRPGGWTVRTAHGPVRARHVVVATGYEHTPVIPDWPGGNRFRGEVLHAAQYRNPAPYRGKRVVVVGGGSSGFEIAHDIATGGADAAWLSVRTPPNILPLWGSAGRAADLAIRIAGVTPGPLCDPMWRVARRVAFGDLTAYGLPIPAEGPMARAARARRSPAVVDRRVIDAIRQRAIEVVAGVESFEPHAVVLVDGVRIGADVVIAATGYRRGLSAVVGHLDVLDEHGVPRSDGEVAAAAGLWFIGFFCRPTLIGFVAGQAERFADRIAADVASGAGADSEAVRGAAPTPR